MAQGLDVGGKGRFRWDERVWNGSGEMGFDGDDSGPVGTGVVGLDVVGRAGADFKGGFFDLQGGDGGGSGFGVVGLAAVFPATRDEFFDGEAKGFLAFGFVSEELAGSEGDHRAVVHGVMHGGAGGDDAVEEGEGAADGLAGGDCHEESALGGAVEV